ncbi:hypothetical protein MXB_1805, partial [Myxobolus squamalis]
ACSKYFVNKRNYKLNIFEKIEIFNSYLIIIIFTDILSIISSLLFLSQIVSLVFIREKKYRQMMELAVQDSLLPLMHYLFGLEFCVFVPFSLCAYCTIGPYHQK